MSKILALTCETSRRTTDTLIAVEPAVAPVPLATKPAQVQDATVAVRAAKHITVEGDHTDRLPGFRNLFLVIPEVEEMVAVKRDGRRVCQNPAAANFSADALLPLEPFCGERDFVVVVEESECRRARIAGCIVRPVLADEGGGTEGGCFEETLVETQKTG